VSDLRWRPSMFAPVVVHLVRDGGTAFTSDRYPGERYVHAACGQDTSIDGVEVLDSRRCPECLVWLERNSNNGKG
jgi:hypothetical protein